MIKKFAVLFLMSAALVSTSATGQDAKKGIPGVGPTSELTKAQTGFTFLEGPIADGKGNLYFTDIRTFKIHKVDAKNNLTEFLDKSEQVNGLMFNSKGELVGCESKTGQIVAFNVETKAKRVVADKFNGNRFNAPNDLVVDKQDGVYFSDPSYNAPKMLPQDKTAVYYVDAKGKVSRLIDDLNQPNGVVLSPDEKTLYVIPTGSADVWKYPVVSPGKIGKGEVLTKLTAPAGGKAGGGDGCAMDVKGNLYVAAGNLIYVINPKGETLGHIQVPEACANIDFGGPDMKTLFVAGRSSLWSAPMEVAGHQFGKK